MFCILTAFFWSQSFDRQDEGKCKGLRIGLISSTPLVLVRTHAAVLWISCSCQLDFSDRPVQFITVVELIRDKCMNNFFFYILLRHQSLDPCQGKVQTTIPVQAESHCWMRPAEPCQLQIVKAESRILGLHPTLVVKPLKTHFFYKNDIRHSFHETNHLVDLWWLGCNYTSLSNLG